MCLSALSRFDPVLCQPARRAVGTKQGRIEGRRPGIRLVPITYSNFTALVFKMGELGRPHGVGNFSKIIETQKIINSN